MIRYHKGIQKIKRISRTSPLKTALYEILESGKLGDRGTKHILPVRLCWRKKKEVGF